MMYGLTEEAVLEIQEILHRYPDIDHAVIYGSRAKGNYRNGSDIDLTLFGDKVDFRTVSAISGAFDDSLLPYTFDVSSFGQITNDELRDHIRRVGKIFYQRETNEVLRNSG